MSRKGADNGSIRVPPHSNVDSIFQDRKFCFASKVLVNVRALPDARSRSGVNGEAGSSARVLDQSSQQKRTDSSSTRHSLEVQIVAKRVGMNAFLEAGALGGFLTGVPNGFRIDRSPAGPASYNTTHKSRSQRLRRKRRGVFFWKTASWWRSARISACRAARVRKLEATKAKRARKESSSWYPP